jgi:hypothetical protein
MDNDELYYAIPGLRTAEVVAASEKIVAANRWILFLIGNQARVSLGCIVRGGGFTVAKRT